MKLHIIAATVLTAACLNVRADAIIFYETIDPGSPGDHTSLTIPVTSLTGTSLSGQEILLNLVFPGNFLIAAPSTPFTATLSIQTANSPAGPLTLVEGVAIIKSRGKRPKLMGSRFHRPPCLTALNIVTTGERDSF
jgi:hypothetical protein